MSSTYTKRKAQLFSPMSHRRDYSQCNTMESIKVIHIESYTPDDYALSSNAAQYTINTDSSVVQMLHQTAQ